MTLCNYQPFISSSQNLGGINWSKTNLVQVRSPKLCICTNDLTNAMLPISAAICSTLFPWLSLEYAVLGALLMRSITILYNNSSKGSWNEFVNHYTATYLTVPHLAATCKGVNPSAFFVSKQLIFTPTRTFYEIDVFSDLNNISTNLQEHYQSLPLVFHSFVSLLLNDVQCFPLDLYHSRFSCTVNFLTLSQYASKWAKLTFSL